jgi:hypothetical protein
MPEQLTILKLVNLIALQVVVGACGGGAATARAHRPATDYCPLAGDVARDVSAPVGAYPHEMADSLLSLARRSIRPGGGAPGAGLLFLRLDSTLSSERSVALAFRLAAGATTDVGVLQWLAASLGKLIHDRRITQGALPVANWYSVREPERWLVVRALAEAGADSNALAGDELVACLELRRIAPLFVPETANTLMDLSVDTEAFILVMRNLELAGPAGHAVLQRIASYSTTDPDLRRFVSRVMRGLVLEQAMHPTSAF